MKVLFLVLATFLGVLACSKRPAKTDGGQIDVDGGQIGHDAPLVDTGGGDTVGTDGTAIGDTGAGDAVRRPLCDGSQGLRLWMLSAPGNEFRGSMVRVENGMPVLAVDGACSYWIGGAWAEDALSRDRPFRTGTLSDAAARSLEESLPLDDVAALADCRAPLPGEFDLGTRLVRTKTATAACQTSGARFDGAWTAVQTIARTLWENGARMEGALHVAAVEASDGAGGPAAYAWPLTSPLAGFVIDDADWFQAGVSKTVSDPAAVAALRALRDQYLADRGAQPGLFVNWDGLKVTDQGRAAFVFMRDALPYEDARGLLTF